jgi:hypothetical protein
MLEGESFGISLGFSPDDCLMSRTMRITSLSQNVSRNQMSETPSRATRLSALTRRLGRRNTCCLAKHAPE